MSRIPAGRVSEPTCIINGIAAQEGGEVRFHVEKIQVFEDHCKPYFTAEMVIETYDHAHEYFVFPTAEVYISFECKSSDPQFLTKKYTERFRIFSHDSEQMPMGQHTARLRHKLSLIGQEFYNDRHNSVIRMDANRVGTAVATNIHNTFIRSNGNIRVINASGMIGNDKAPHQTSNMKPFTAINNVLSRCVWTQYPGCAPVYFRNKRGYVMGPLHGIMEGASPTVATLTEHTTAGWRWAQEFEGRAKGYNAITALKPLSPSGEASSGVKASEIGALNKASAWIDMLTGSYKIGDSGLAGIMRKLNLNTNVPGVNQKIRAMLAEAEKGRNGGLLFNYIDSLMQERATTKNGPGNFNISQEAFVTALTYADKYWVTVPGQSGHKITCGDKINIEYNVVRNNKSYVRTKKLYVARLVHNVIFSTGTERKATGENAFTDLYGVSWG